MSKGGYTPIAVDAIMPPPRPPRPRSTSLGVRLAILSTACALGPVAAALALGGWPGRFATALFATVAVAATSLLTAWIMVRRITAPLARLVAAAERLGSGERVPEQGPAELIELARSWNQASRRLADGDEEKRILIAQLERGYLDTLRTLVNAIDAKDPYTKGHSQRTAEFAVLIARELDLDAHEVREVEFGGLLHDVGKIGITEAILRKPARLDDEETRIMRGHPRIGDSIVGDIGFLAPMRAMVRNHHERWDGGGYPDGLRGEEIPLGARIISAADAWDAITSDRYYQAGRPIPEAVEIMTNLAGKQLDPVVVDALMKVLEKQGFLEEGAKPVGIAPPEGRKRKKTLDFAVRRED
jgi:HD-GYP domain-containing protein (c-di-GMP phosphodiesterase class II)